LRLKVFTTGNCMQSLTANKYLCWILYLNVYMSLWLPYSAYTASSGTFSGTVALALGNAKRHLAKLATDRCRFVFTFVNFCKLPHKTLALFVLSTNRSLCVVLRSKHQSWKRTNPRKRIPNRRKFQMKNCQWNNRRKKLKPNRRPRMMMATKAT